MSTADELRDIAKKAHDHDEFLAIDDEIVKLLFKAADELDQGKLQCDSAMGVSRKLQDERERMLTRVEFALQGIKEAELQLSDEDEKSSGPG